MKYNKIGNTSYEVSQIAFGAEWMEEKAYDDVKTMITYLNKKE